MGSLVNSYRVASRGVKMDGYGINGLKSKVSDSFVIWSISHSACITYERIFQSTSRFANKTSPKRLRLKGSNGRKPRNRRQELLKLANEYKEEHNPVFGKSF